MSVASLLFEVRGVDMNAVFAFERYSFRAILGGSWCIQ